MPPAPVSVESLLEAIDAADWDLAEGAQGEEGDPMIAADDLRALVSGDPKLHARAFGSLLEQWILGAGWTEAGALATPIVVDLALASGHPARPFALVLLAELVTGDHVPRLARGLDTSDPQVGGPFAAPPAQTILDAVRAAADDLAEGLRDADPRVRSATGFLLAFLSERAGRSYAEVEQAARAEEDLWTQASLFLALAHLARYLGRPLAASTLEGWIAPGGAASAQATPPVLTVGGARAVAWLAELYADRGRRLVTPSELTPGRRDDLLAFVRAGDPSADVFAWGRNNLDRVLATPLHGRGDAARVFAGGVLAQVADEGTGPVDRHVNEALGLCFGPPAPQPRLVVLGEVDAGRRDVLETLSRREHLTANLGRFGLTPYAWDRRRWLGSDARSALERDAVLDDGREGQLWQRLHVARGSPRPETLEAACSRVRAELDERAPQGGTDRLEAAALLAIGAHGLHSVAGLESVYAAIEAAGDAAGPWARAWLPRLLEHQPGNTRGSGVGTACVWALVRGGAAGPDLPPEYDALLSFSAPDAVLRAVLAALPPERREAVVLREVRAALASSWNGHLTLDRLLALADLCATPAVGADARALAEAVAKSSFLSTTAPAEAGALRDRVLARFG